LKRKSLPMAEYQIQQEWYKGVSPRRKSSMPMPVLLNCGFGSLVGMSDLGAIRNLGFTGIRQDILDPGAAGALVSETIAANMPSLFIVRTTAQAVAAAKAIRMWPSFGLELGNEEDARLAPREYHRRFIETSAAIRAVNPSVKIWTAGITTTDKRRMGWLEEVYAQGIPSDAGCAIHGYAQELPPSVPRPGFKSRAEEYAAIRRIIGEGRPLGQSEIGWHTAPFKVKKGWFGSAKRQWSDEQVASFLAGELTVAKNNGLEFSTIFQWNSGTDLDNHEHQFGIRTVEGALKPQAHAVSAWVRGNQ
jgi:hypothetical protein